MSEAPPAELWPDATGAGIVVAVVDTGVNFQHPHLRRPARGCSVIWHNEELQVRAGAAADLHGHGTCCAALVTWLAPNVDVVSIHVADERGVTDADRLMAGIEEAGRRAAHIILCSLGVRTRLGRAVCEAVTQATDGGALVVAAAGPETDILPAGCPDALAVGVCEGVDVRLGPNGAVVADGFPRPAPGPRNFSGSSMAAARTAAACARLAETHRLRGRRLKDAFSKALDVC